MKTELDPVDNAKLPNHDKREWRAPVLIKETTAITKSAKASNITEVNGPPNFGPPS